MKKINLTLEDIFEIPGAVVYNSDKYSDIELVSIDSRNIKKGSLFIAIKGEKFDGHDFVREVLKKNVSAVMIDQNKYKNFSDLELPVITVNDTTKALGDLARMWRRKLYAICGLNVIAITGSAGKTSTKEMIAAMLAEKYKVNKTILNNNNHIGVPLTILSTNEKHQVLVLELGTNHFGEIQYTSSIAEPDYALITNIGSSHLEFLKNKRGVLKEKFALFEETIKNNGTLFINQDDPLLKNSVKNYNRQITYSFKYNSDVRGELKGIDKNGKEIVELNYKNINITGAFVYGEQNARNLLASSAVAFRLGLNKNQILNGIKKNKPIDKRLTIKNYKNKITLIDDTYNANPESMKYAIETLNKISGGRKKIAVLGDMFELGIESEKYHIDLAKVLVKNKINEVHLTGAMMKSLYSELSSKKISGTCKAKHYDDRKNLEKSLLSLGYKNTIVLVKGSRGMKMEEFVKILEGKIKG